MLNAVVLLSGGIDSMTTAAVAAEQGFALYALTFAYGQRHAIEVEAAKRVAAALEVKQHVIQTIDLRAYGGSALTADLEVPKDRTPQEIGKDVPITYVPARNTIFLAHALGYAESLKMSDIYIGAAAVDYGGYPDCRPEFLEKFEELANVATASAVSGMRHFSIRAPLIDASKAEIIKEGVRLGLDYGLTHSCYAPTTDGLACGRCDSCVLRADAFKQAGVSDPTRYGR